MFLRPNSTTKAFRTGFFDQPVPERIENLDGAAHDLEYFGPKQQLVVVTRFLPIRVHSCSFVVTFYTPALPAAPAEQTFLVKGTNQRGHRP